MTTDLAGIPLPPGSASRPGHHRTGTRVDALQHRGVAADRRSRAEPGRPADIRAGEYRDGIVQDGLVTDRRVVTDLAMPACVDAGRDVGTGVNDVAVAQFGERRDRRPRMIQAHRRETELLKLSGQRAPSPRFSNRDHEMCSRRGLTRRENWQLADRRARGPVVEEGGDNVAGGKSCIEHLTADTASADEVKRRQRITPQNFAVDRY